MIWVVGCGGMLGKEFVTRLEADDIEFSATDKEIDISDRDAVMGHCKDAGFKWIINCAAYTNVDKAEEEYDLAYKVNTAGPRNLAEAAEANLATLVHFSTDYVFSGLARCRYTERSPMGSLSVYGKTKAMGEVEVSAMTKRHMTFRISWLHGAHGRNFVSTMLELFKNKDVVKVVADQYGTPTWAGGVAEDVLDVVKDPRRSNRYGTYHRPDSGEATWHEFASAVLAEAKARGMQVKPDSIIPLTTQEWPTKAVRPSYSVMDNTKAMRELGMPARPWLDGLRSHFNQIAGKS